MDAENDKPNLNRKLTLWLMSFLVISSCLVFLFQVALIPILLGGGLVLIIVLIRHYSQSKSQH